MNTVSNSIEFDRRLLTEVYSDVKKFDPTVKTVDAVVYIELSNVSTGKRRWFTFDFRGFHFEGYFDNAYEAKAKAWNKWLDKMKGKTNETADTSISIPSS